ncbi:uncharacterized protein LOC127850112 isoform X1 [Dreissena polymorpha]|uniref:uncharacterized protein LOC127850112 isoform X1 n=2 Tax=Dreissena polymorpha TaxID=45954 RepID=UPI0022655EDE|nr:uncharacterized protein LOC127850112 isoform X1 [Dreissena polymorpha]
MTLAYMQAKWKNGSLQWTPSFILIGCFRTERTSWEWKCKHIGVEQRRLFIEFVCNESEKQFPKKMSTHPLFLRTSLPAASPMFIICVSLFFFHSYSTNEYIGYDKHSRCSVNTAHRDSKVLAIVFEETLMPHLDGLPLMFLDIKYDDILYRTQTRVNGHIRCLADHRTWKVLSKTSRLHYHNCESNMVISLSQKIQSVKNTTTELQYMFTSLNSPRKLSAAALTALRLLLILSGIEPNPGPFNKENGVFSNAEYNLQIYTHDTEESPTPAYPVENEEQTAIAVQAVDDADGSHSFVATSSGLSELPIPWSYQSQTQSTSLVQQHSDNITPLQIHESSIVSRIELDISERYGQSEIRCNSSSPEVSNTHRWRGEATAYPTAKYLRYAAVEDRTSSFRNWPRTRPTIPALCQSGFFYTGNDDLVRCFCCGIGLKDFSDTDDPLQEHVRHSRNCAYLLVLLGGQDGIERYHRSLPTHDPEEIRRQQRLRYNSQRSVPATGYRARHERLRSLQSRLDTFTNWPSHVTQRPQELAEAGLYYTGNDDHCRCFACDGGLRKWEHGDDPWIEHCRWFPACPYAREVKGRDFIDLIQLSADQAAEENASAPQQDMT